MGSPRKLHAALLLPLLAALLGAEAEAPAEPPRRGGFELSDARVPPEEILAGGPERDQIRSIDAPVFAVADDVTWLRAEDAVIGLHLGGRAHAYPVHLLEWHQIVNDRIGELPVAVAYDPLTGAARAYHRSARGRTLELGVSGLVYNSSFLLHDRETASLWLHWTGEALAGTLAGERLVEEPVRQEPYGAWLARYPESRVLAPPAESPLDYRYSPYKRYWIQDSIPFPVRAEDRSFHPKELVLGLRAGGATRAYLGSQLTAAGGGLRDRFAEHAIAIEYASELGAFRYEIPPEVKVSESYWFAWKAFHPDTEIWRAPEPSSATP